MVIIMIIMIVMIIHFLIHSLGHEQKSVAETQVKVGQRKQQQ